MPANIEKVDLRSIKTGKALDVAMLSLLETRNFQKITVKDISDEALVSRATFYAHFADKYDFLKTWLATSTPDISNKNLLYENIENSVNAFIHKNETIIRNLVNDADKQTIEILYDTILRTLFSSRELEDMEKPTTKSIVISYFYAGGIFAYLLWHVNNRFPSDVPPMNIHLYEIIEKFQEWKS